MAPSSKVRGYSAGSPWRFKGRALYQMNLVKADIARRYVPSELKLVEAFGYTLGGFFLAHYDDSPVGPFDELVVIAGIVWNPPTSSAWAARVLVNNVEACRHGRKEVGLPSHYARFSQTAESATQDSLALKPLPSFWNRCFPRQEKPKHGMNIVREDLNPWCHIALPYSLMKEAGTKGPSVKFSLPSFSGHTEQQPRLLKYSCDLSCKVTVAKSATVSSLRQGLDGGVLDILSSKPVVAIGFDNMNMAVKAPLLAPSSSQTPGSHQPSCS